MDYGKLGNPLHLRTWLKWQTWLLAPPQQWQTWCLPILSDLRSRKWFLFLWSVDLSSYSSNALWFFYSLGWKLIFLLVCHRIKCYIVLIHLFVLLPTEYFVLGYSLLDNLMHYKKWFIMYENLVNLNNNYNVFFLVSVENVIFLSFTIKKAKIFYQRNYFYHQIFVS